MGSSASASVLLVSLTAVPCALEDLVAPLARSSQSEVRVQAMRVDLSPAYDPGRNQYSSTQLLRMLLGLPRPSADRIVGVVDVDLFVPILTYVFGEAQLGGQAAVVSTFRLREPWLETPLPKAVVRRRLLQTLLHELGHTFGLRHCPRPSCVMTSASNLEMLDEKSDDFCMDCQAQARRARA